jgi:sterol desaturase/sphingolipid hydroxylase (fatty acid hydroxylase superfamily)
MVHIRGSGGKVAAAAMAGLAGLALLSLAERRWPRRRSVEPAARRLPVNLGLGAMSLAVVALLERPLAGRVAGCVAARRLGLAQAIPGPAWLRDLAAMLLLDAAAYHWHVATHRLPFLWRLHRVHHADHDMDWTTALRFHAADMVLTVPKRMLEVRLFGVSPRALDLYGAWFFGHVAFHHANLALRFDAALSHFITSPGMHDIHHRADARATDRNFSSGLSVWDRMFGTFSDQRPAVGMGNPGWQTRPALRFGEALALPFSAE